MPASVVETIPKELYLLIGAVLGFVGAMLTTLINRRTQLKLARENNQSQAEREGQTYLRGKLEEAYLILAKMVMENSLIASTITQDAWITRAEYNARYQENGAELRRFQMIAAMYVPQLQDAGNTLADLTFEFWFRQRHLMHLCEAFEGEPVPVRQATLKEIKEIKELAEKIREQVRMTQQQLQVLISDTMLTHGMKC